MSRFLAAALAGFFLSGVASASTGGATSLAVGGGFLLGNADRCGVSGERVARAGRIIDRLIRAAAGDAGEARSAERRFAAVFLATAHPAAGGHALIPSCRVVRAQFDRLERHHRQAGLD
ncbi:MAG TPA: hypothetical protein VGR91_14345 [Stellaceae bacterium]|nr:hypothetical protein [Stellaceae bacterium]